MKLLDLTPQERKALAAKVGCNPIYLYQVATGIRTLSDEMAVKLNDAEPRLDMASLKPVLAKHFKAA